jgi:hypothetical protein
MGEKQETAHIDLTNSATAKYVLSSLDAQLLF